MECDISYAACQAMVAGTLVGSDGSPTRIRVGTLRDGAKQLPIDVKFFGFLPWVRYRCVVRGNVATTYLNGLAVRTEQLTSQDSWIAVRSWCRSHASARDMRITGNPVVPESIDLSASSDLRGWYPYHDESAGTTGARWEHLAEPESMGQIFGQADGRHIAWALGNNIVLLDFPTRKRTMLMTHEQSALFSYVYPGIEWSFDSQSITFKARTSDRTNTFVAVADVGPDNRFRIIHSGPEHVSDNVTWHPDNQRVVFSVGDQASQLSRLLLINRNAPSDNETILGPPPDWNILSTDWSPDGHLIIFTAHVPPQPVDWPLPGG